MKMKIKNAFKLILTIIYYIPLARLDYEIFGLVCGQIHTSWRPILIVTPLCFVANFLYALLPAVVRTLVSDLFQESEAVSISNHGNHLEEVMEAIRNEEFEYSAYFDLEGNKLAEGTLQSSLGCNITTEDWEFISQRGEEVIKIHNHPGRGDLAFSAGDFKAFLFKDFFRKSIVVTRNYNYILEKTGNNYESLQNKVQRYCIMMGIKYLWLALFSNRRWSVVVARKTAERFGLKFNVERVY